ncbi:uncharacterized protein EI97DRAFT_57071 [Westerdykella ornata]|uniref:Vacuolar import and degradation protein-domain-containing protein n=1 Tax=Westerdykella ornata TaxID=318751 RepID=A0A6A6JGQ3_WESOR|nr:uncharacterized protein EI97DRAFT_57071 [Westerdykella ornata]KAF2275830.1 hypothetical protein EI97DRAFT_57071 [Westerdykella ornata]
MPPANSRETSPPDLAPRLASPSYPSALQQPTEPFEPPETNMERSRRQRSDSEQQDRLRRVMNRLRRIHDPPGTSYGDRVPRENYLYDWSPANEANEVNEADEAAGEDELDQMLAEMASARPSPHPDGRRQSRIPSQHSSRPLNSNQSSASASWLRSALASRRNAHVLNGSPDHTSRSPDRTMARDPYSTSNASDTRPLAIQRLAARRSMLEMEIERDRERERNRNRNPYLDLAEREQIRRDRFLPPRSDPRRLGHWIDDSEKPAPAASALFERTIRYLSRIRHVDNILDGREYAVEAGLLQDNVEPEPDFLLHTLAIPPPPPSSWLAPGAILSGCQHATSLSTTVTTSAVSNTLYRFRNGDYLTSTLFDYSGPLGPEYIPAHERHLPLPGPDTVLSHNPQQDRWPVKVTIHAVDYENMSLSATMEAYNVPSHPHSHQSSGGGDSIPSCARMSSITTYLEGEILDFKQHTLLTESFKSTAANDATYWHKLPCFRGYSVEQLALGLTNRHFYDMLARDWILMRWKERCFVKKCPDSASPAGESHGFEHEGSGEAMSDEYVSTFVDSNCGLTISGFYYVCLRREDGKLEGLYCDPQSSPYQCLKLESVSRGVFPARAFR